jgi:hypothetical protein
MKSRTVIAAVLAALVLSTGTAAALPGNAPDGVGQADEHAQDEHAEETAENADDAADNASGESEEAMNESESEGERGPPSMAEDARPEDAGSQGPPTDMPEQVPDHVTQIHETINQFLGGDSRGRSALPSATSSAALTSRPTKTPTNRLTTPRRARTLTRNPRTLTRATTPRPPSPRNVALISTL